MRKVTKIFKSILIPCAAGISMVFMIWATWLAIDFQLARSHWARMHSATDLVRFPAPSRRLSACQNTAIAETQFAFVSMITNDPGIYSVSAGKLATSVRAWTDADLIMMVFDSIPLADSAAKLLTNSGWKICILPTIESPPTKVRNRYLDGKMYSKFNAWSLIEYDAVLVVDSDTLVLADPTPVFTEHYPLMVSQNKTFAAALDRPRNSTCRVWGNVRDYFNAGILLILPSQATFQMLNRSIMTVEHNPEWAEQRLLNVLYRGALLAQYYELPFIFNANMICRSCEPSVWDAHRADLRIVHFTVAKGWTYSAKWDTWEDTMLCWWWGLRDYCLLWDMVDTGFSRSPPRNPASSP